MAESVYILCALTSSLCAVLLMRNYRRSRARLLLWSALCFACFAVGNILLFVDLVVVPDVDFSELRQAITLAGLAMLLHGLIWETK